MGAARPFRAAFARLPLLICIWLCTSSSRVYRAGVASMMEGMVEIQRDGKGQPYIQWEQAPGGWKRAWIQTKDGEGDRAGTTAT